MLKNIMSMIMISIASYFIYQNRYKVMNSLLGSSFLRRIAVGSVLSIPGIRNKVFQTVFSGPANFK